MQATTRGGGFEVLNPEWNFTLIETDVDFGGIQNKPVIKRSSDIGEILCSQVISCIKKHFNQKNILCQLTLYVDDKT